MPTSTNGAHRSTMARRRGRRAGMAGGLAVALMVATAVAAVAAPAFTVGTPQPELALFRVGASGASGTGAALADGTLVLASLEPSGTAVTVCVLHPGGRACAVTHSFSVGGQDLSGSAQVLSLGGRHVAVIVDASSSGVTVFNSLDDGVTFGSPVTDGPAMYGENGGTVVGGRVVITAEDPHSGVEVQAFDPAETTPETALAQVSADNYDASVSGYHGGLLVASDDGTNTHVSYAPSGLDINSSGSYRPVGTFAGQIVSGISGNALLTDPGGSITGGQDLRFFNGSTFGAAHKVPEPKEGDDGYFTLQEVGGVVHVFYLNRRHSYDIYSVTTTDGIHWSGLQIYNTAATSGLLYPVLGASGAGVVFEGDSIPLLAQPILNGQDVRIRLAQATIRAHRSTQLRGTAAPKLPGQTVTLERLSAGRWYNVASGHETAAGTISFTVTSAQVYRVVVAEDLGYDLYGYSNSVTLSVRK